LRKKTFIAALLALGLSGALIAGTAGARPSATVTGAGSTFAAPLYALWAQNYKAATITYNPIGSGGGIQAITNKQVDFGASDAPLTKDQFASCPCVQIPVLMSGTAIDYNIPGASPGLRITGPILAEIYLGKIDYWDNAKIKKINKGKTIPHTKITPIFRSDGSGTTYNFTDYLSKVSREFKNKVGYSTQVQFPVGIGSRGSSGVSSTVKQTSGGVTYTDVAYAIKNHLKFFRVRNSAGKYTTPGIRAIQSAASLVKRVPANNELHIVDPPASKKYINAYPICTFSWVIVQKSTSHAAEIKSFVKWALTKGQRVPGALKLLYIPIPKVVEKAGIKTLSKIH
jgi:phosphate transport system substrate-binding protein